MPNNLNKQPFPRLKRAKQITSSFCGPAVLEMLLSLQGVQVSQAALGEATGASHIENEGTTIHELGQAVKNLFPELQFWYKFNSNIQELSQLVNTYQIPVGVEWQGIFDWPDDEDEPEDDSDYGDDDDDAGHYSIITALDTQHNIILIADPERHYAGTDRQFSVLQFERRWWDINNTIDPQTGKKHEVDDYHALFIITRKDAVFPETLHLVRA